MDVLEAKVGNIEAKIRELQDSFAAALTHMQHSMMQEFSKMLGKKVDGEEEESVHQDDHLEEYRMSVRKVELLMFDGSDPVGWITRAEI